MLNLTKANISKEQYILPTKQITMFCSDGRLFGNNRRWPQIAGAAAVPFLWGREAGYPSNTMSPRPRPTSAPSGILIHPTISFGHNTPTLQTAGTTAP